MSEKLLLNGQPYQWYYLGPAYCQVVLCVTLLVCASGSWADRTALHEAASQGRALQLKQLIESGASVNTVTTDNSTPLHEACIQARPNCARLLLEAGAQVSSGSAAPKMQRWW